MTTQSRNKLRELEAKVKGLPDQSALVRRHQLFRNAQTQAQQRVAEFQLTQKQIKALRAIRADASVLLDIEERRLSSAREKASELVSAMEKADPDSGKLGERLEAIKRTGKALADDVQSNWARFCEEQRDYATALRPLADRLSPELARRIVELTDLLISVASNAPTSIDVAQRFTDARKALDEEVASLNLNVDAPIVRFIQEAQVGMGDPRALFDAQIRKYLDENPTLWKSLRVTLV
jgi:hypothetical protein